MAKKVKADDKSRMEVNALLLPDMPVYSVCEGAAVGRVKEVVIDPVEKRLLGLAVDKGGWYHDVRVIVAGKISTMGDDLIMVDEKQAAKAPNLPKIVENMKNPCNIIGARVISREGRALGRVETFYLARESGEITRLEVSCGVVSRFWAGRLSIPAAHIITLGEEAIVVENMVENVTENMMENVVENMAEDSGQCLNA